MWREIDSIILNNNYIFTEKFDESIFRVRVFSNSSKIITSNRISICCFDGVDTYWNYRSIYPKIDRWLAVYGMDIIPELGSRAIGFKTTSMYVGSLLMVELYYGTNNR